MENNNYNNTYTEDYYNNSKRSHTNGYAIASLVLGIVSLFGILTFGILGIIFGVTAIVLGLLSKNKQPESDIELSGIGLAGIISGFIGFIVGAMFLGLVIYAGVNLDNPSSIFYYQQESIGDHLPK